jgi:beta-lactamase regulating signal transducer with metallopeptidase domain
MIPMSLVFLAISSILLVSITLFVFSLVIQIRQRWSNQQQSYLRSLAAPVHVLAASCLIQLIAHVILLGRYPLPFVSPVFWQWGVYWVTIGTIVVSLGGLLGTVFRGILLVWFIQRRSMPAPAYLIEQVGRQAEQMGIAPPDIRLWSSTHQFAAVCGFQRPILLLSPWSLSELDAGELEMVILHELAHIVRRDYHYGWLVVGLRDAFIYLPMSHRYYARLRQAQEWACDDLAVAVTHRPLALASALAKAWQQSVSHRLAPVAPLTGEGASLSVRIERLLAPSPQPELPAMADMRATRWPYPLLMLMLVGCSLVTILSATILLARVLIGNM